MKEVYFDHAATTPVFPEVIKEMNDIYENKYANSASAHLQGQSSAAVLEDSREKIAHFLGAKKAEEIVFTSGGTESDNLAIKGIAMALADKGKHIITSSIEHHAVLESCEFLKKHLNFDISYLDVDDKGFISIEELKASIREDTVLISLIYANNEIGTIQNIKKLAAVAENRDIVFHTDAVQAAAYLDLDVNELGVDLLSISAHKFNGPKGVGALFVREGIELTPQMSGGNQERKRRAGTVNLPAVAGMARAAEITSAKLEEKNKKLNKLRNYFIDNLKDNFDNIKINGADSGQILPSNLNISFKDLDSETLLYNLSLNNISASAGSACASGSLSLSHVLKAIDIKKSYAEGTIRFSISNYNTKEEIDYVIKKLKEITERLKSLK